MTHTEPVRLPDRQTHSIRLVIGYNAWQDSAYFERRGGETWPAVFDRAQRAITARLSGMRPGAWGLLGVPMIRGNLNILDLLYSYHKLADGIIVSYTHGISDDDPDPSLTSREHWNRRHT